jgi:DNA-directed RNA polymerase subunit F
MNEGCLFFGRDNKSSLHGVNYNLHTKTQYSSSQFNQPHLNRFTVNDSDDDISSLLDELSSFAMPAQNTQKAIQDTTPLKPEDLQQYFLDKTKALVEAGLGAVQDLTPSVVSGSDSREIEALSKLMTSTAQALEALQRTALIDKKADRDEKLEKIRQDGRKEVAMLTQGPKEITNNNILVASREEIMKKLFSKENEEDLKVINK